MGDPTAESAAKARLDRHVSVSFASQASYPSTPPFHPAHPYPEYPFAGQLGSEPNSAYDAARESLHLLGLDRENYGTPAWNPLGEIVRPGDCVLLKPNFVKESRTDVLSEWIQVITHGSVIRAVADYVYIALRGHGRIIVADGPQTDSDFDAIRELTGLRVLQDFYRQSAGFQLEVYDLRNEHWIERDGVYVDRERLAGDPAGTVAADLGARTHLSDIGSNKYYGAFYDIEETNRHHSNGHHEYAFCLTPLLADVVIHLPKLKTHKKCGVTINLKGLVGLNGNKNWLPHYIFGTPKNKGDQFADPSVVHAIENALVRWAKKLLLGDSWVARVVARKLKSHAYGVFGKTSNTVRSGNWYGNDTVWRMALDLAAVLTFADADGRLHDSPQRRFFSVVDGIIAGEGNGPMEADALPTGIIVSGSSPVSVDAVCARLMGFDYRKLPIIANAFRPTPWPFVQHRYDEIRVFSNRSDVDTALLSDPTRRIFQFRPHFGWVGRIELPTEAASSTTPAKTLASVQD